jgi:SAM-dependent methyltransferase
MGSGRRLGGVVRRLPCQVLSPERIALAHDAQVDAEWLESTLTVSLEESEYTLRWLAPWLDGRGPGPRGRFRSRAHLGVPRLDRHRDLLAGARGLGLRTLRAGQPAPASVARITHPHLAVSIEDITTEQAGTFDLIFSNNVLEHVDDVETALGALSALLRPGGVMVHNCPNYSVPYEPHFGIPLVPIRPASTARVLPDTITSTGLWQSINFVTAREVRRIAARQGAEVSFERGLLGDTMERFAEPEFARRHPALARLAGVLGAIAPVLRRVPPALATPMIVSWRVTDRVAPISH